MKKAVLIADSGGSKTDWCLCDSLGNKHVFTTESYHPHLINDEWITEKKEFWKEYVQVYELEVHFFGSGCAHDLNKKIIIKAFDTWGIHRVNVESDIMGAAKACFGDNDAYIAILGTGSVLAEIAEKEVKKIYGGLGFILGDEGSGFHFGKLILQKYFHEQLSPKVRTEIEQIAGAREAIIQSVYGLNGKKYISGLSEKLSACQSEEISSIHEENINQFIQLYLPVESEGKHISFVGSYAYYNSEILRKRLVKKGWKVGEIIERPIERLTEYVLKSAF